MSTWSSNEDFASQLRSTDKLNLAPCPSEFPENPSQSKSFWIKEFPVELDQRFATATVPEEVDVVIIGSGISGAAAAYEFSQQDPSLRIALFEARGICTGATGRNGGHFCRPEVFALKEITEKFGLEDGLRIQQLCVRNRDIMLDAVQRLDIADKIDLRVNGTVVVFEKKEDRKTFEGNLALAKELGYTPECSLLSSDEVLQMVDITPNTAQYGAAYLKKSGTVYPRKLVNALLESVVNRMPSFSLHPFTPVQQVTCQSANGVPKYTVKTTKGAVQARAVLHATNAYVSRLLPSLGGSDGVFGCQAHMLGIQPLDAAQKPQLSVGFGYADFWHWLQQRPDHGPFLYGLATAEKLNEYDDRSTIPEDNPVRKEMYGFLENTFPSWFASNEVQKCITHDWTGIQGFTMSGVSIVGRPVKESSGEFVSVAFQGEGMTRCFASSTVVANGILAYLRGDESFYPPEWYPKAYWRDVVKGAAN